MVVQLSPSNATVDEKPKLRLVPVTLSVANEYVQKNHRHHGKVVGWKFGVGVALGDKLVGVAIASRPVARNLDQENVLEVTRLCSDGTPHVPSMLYSAIARAAKALGYTKVVTYILDSEPGTSLVASGWKQEATVKGKSWNCNARQRGEPMMETLGMTPKYPTCDKTRWSKTL